jgi:hypothetical protein
MQENEFEKQVREKMEEFKIAPSSSVWDKVEQRIPKEKRHRRWIVFIFLFAGFTVWGYLIYNNYYNSGAIKNVVAKNQNDKTKNNLNDNKKNNEANTSNIISQESSAQKKPEEKNTTIADNKIYKNSFSVSAKEERQFDKSANENKVSTPAINLNDELEKNETTIKGGTEKNSLPDTSNKSTTAFEANEQPKDTLRRDILKDSTQTATLIKTNKKQSKQNPDKKWQFGITAFYGRSDVFENLFGIKLNTTPVPAFANADQNAVSGFPRNPNTFSRGIKAKGAFSIGIAAKKDLSSKSSLTIGLQYSKFQTEIETGLMKDSSATFRYNNLNIAPIANLNTYYKPGTGYPHKNSYSFIQIPVVYEHSLLKNKLLNGNAGVSLSRLISSNALVYDEYNQAYYNNNDLFRRTQVTLLAGVNTQFSLGKTSVHLGPQFQYGLTNLFKQNDYGSQHLFSWGLQANIFLGK